MRTLSDNLHGRRLKDGFKDEVVIRTTWGIDKFADKMVVWTVFGDKGRRWTTSGDKVTCRVNPSFMVKFAMKAAWATLKARRRD